MHDLKSQDAFYFSSSVFIILKAGQERNFMVTFDTIDQWHRSFGLPGIWDTTPDRFKIFTSVSTLDENLFTKVEYILSKGRVFLRTDYDYYADGSGRIEMKHLQVFLPKDDNLNQKLDDSICLSDIENAVVVSSSDWAETIYPILDKKQNHYRSVLAIQLNGDHV